MRSVPDGLLQLGKKHLSILTLSRIVATGVLVCGYFGLEDDVFDQPTNIEKTINFQNK